MPTITFEQAQALRTPKRTISLEDARKLPVNDWVDAPSQDWIDVPPTQGFTLPLGWKVVSQPPQQAAPAGSQQSNVAAQAGMFDDLIPSGGTQPPQQGSPDFKAMFAPAATPSSPVTEHAKQYGALEGVAGIQGIPGEIDKAARMGAQLILGKLGISEDRVNLAEMPSFVPSADQVTGAYEKAVGGFEKPATTSQEYARTLGQFAPAAATGPGRVVRRGLQAAIIHPRVTAAMRRVQSEADQMKPKQPGAMSALTGAAPAAGKGDLPLTEAQTLRRVLSAAARSQEKDERRLASMMIEKLDDLVDSYGGQKWAKARGLYHKFSKAQQIEDMLENAGIRSGQFSVSGMENALRTEFRQLQRKIIKDGRERSRWTPEQRRLIKKLGNMRGAVNILRTIGKLSPRSQLMLAGGVGGAGLSFGSGDPTAVGTAGLAWGVGTAAQLAALGQT